MHPGINYPDAITAGPFVLVRLSFLHQPPIQPTRAPPSAGVQQPCATQSLGVTEGGLTNPTTSDRAKQDDEHRETWVFRCLSSVSASRSDSRTKTNPFSPLVLFFPPRHLAPARTPLIEDLRLTDLCASSGPFVNSAILLSRKFCRFERRHFEVRRPWE